MWLKPPPIVLRDRGVKPLLQSRFSTRAAGRGDNVFFTVMIDKANVAPAFAKATAWHAKGEEEEGAITITITITIVGGAARRRGLGCPQL